MIITRNYTGHRVGECHQNAKLTDAQVRDMRYRHEKLGVSRVQLMEIYKASYWTVRDILTYATRGSA